MKEENSSLMLEDWMNPDDDIIAGHNLLGMDYIWLLHKLGAEAVVPPPFDTLVAEYLLDENRNDNSLEGLASAPPYSLVDRLTDEELVLWRESKKLRHKLAELPIERVMAYCAVDAKLTYWLAVAQKERLEAAGLDGLMDFLMEAGLVLTRATVRGVNFDWAWSERVSQQLTEERDWLENELLISAGDYDLNLRSGDAIADFLFADMGLPVQEWTDGGTTGTKKPAVGKKQLNSLRAALGDSDIAAWIKGLLDFRDRDKVLGTFVNPWRDKWLRADGRIHGYFYIGKGKDEWSKGGFGAGTGRTSSSKPNLQNVAKSREVMGMLVPDHGKVFSAVDYSQLELRVLAWLSGDPGMLAAIAAGRDLHTQGLVEIWRSSGRSETYEDVMALLEAGDTEAKHGRWMVKRINFGIAYGAGAWTLSNVARDELGIDVPQDTSQKWIDDWYKARPGVAEWIKRAEDRVRNKKYIVSPTGQYRRLKDVDHKWESKRKAALRQGVNSVIQTTAAHLNLLAVTFIDKHPSMDFLLQVHDNSLVQHKPHVPAEAVLRFNMLYKTRKRAAELWDETAKREWGVSFLDLPLGVGVDTNMTRWGEK